MLLGFDQLATVRTAVAAGDYTTVATTGLRCRLCRPGIQTQAANDAVQMLFQPFWQYASATGDFTPANRIIKMWAKANDIDDREVTLTAMMPPAPPEGEPGGEKQPSQPPPS